jgi:hypothetical protein
LRVTDLLQSSQASCLAVLRHAPGSDCQRGRVEIHQAGPRDLTWKTTVVREVVSSHSNVQIVRRNVRLIVLLKSLGRALPDHPTGNTEVEEVLQRERPPCVNGQIRQDFLIEGAHDRFDSLGVTMKIIAHATRDRRDV